MRAVPVGSGSIAQLIVACRSHARKRLFPAFARPADRSHEKPALPSLELDGILQSALA